jgi:hypothetical protein
MNQDKDDNNNSVETVHKIINALENPDDPKRIEAITIQQAKLKRWKLLERYGATISSIVFITLCLFLLKNLRIEKSILDNWQSITVGVFVGIVILILARIRRFKATKPLQPKSVLVFGIVLAVSVFIADEIRRRISSSTREFISVATVTFLMTMSVYGLAVNLRAMWKNDESLDNWW